MKYHETNPRTISPVRSIIHLRPEFALLSLLVLTALWYPASAQPSDTALISDSAPLTAEQVVQNLVRMNIHRGQTLHAFQGTRIYRVEYQGFPGTRSAEMIVAVKYLSPGRKEFSIQSATGSKLIIDKVFKKLLEAEKEALDAEIQRRSALNGDNYVFTLVAYDRTPNGSTYVLKVEPRTNDKFLYRGQIWVNGEDFAVTRLEAEPAKNPSFWTKNSEIEQVYMKVGDFWLPARNRSISTIRLGGRAELTIDYNDYEITGATTVTSLPALRSTPPLETARAEK